MSDMLQEMNNEVNPDPQMGVPQEQLENQIKSVDLKRTLEGASSVDPVMDSNMNILMGVKLLVTVELGRTNLSVKEVLELQKGSVIELERIAGEAVDIFVNESLIARGDVVVVDDKFGVRITELIPIEKNQV